MGHRHALWLIAPLLLAVVARLLAAAGEPRPRTDPAPPDCRRWVQLGDVDTPLICLDGDPGARLTGAGATTRCLRQHPPHTLTAGDRLAPDSHGGCHRRRMRAAAIRVLRLPVDLNRASAAELATLPGVGPKLARRITAYRRQHGPFLHVDDLRSVRGIGPRLLGRIRPRVSPP